MGEIVQGDKNIHHETIHGDKIAGDKIGRDQNIYYGPTYILPEEAPPLFFGVPDFPRFGLVGRDDLLQELINRLVAGNAVSLSASGQGGVGKTALAVAAAYRRDLLAHFSDGVLWASVGPAGNPLLELGRWAEALKLDPKQFPNPTDLKRAVKNIIGQRKLLLVLDDIWDPDHAELLRCGGPFCAHLLTTRKNDIAATFAGGPQNDLPVPELDPDPALTLLERISGPNSAVDQGEARRLLSQVGGLPLEVELLGGYLNQGGAPDPEMFPDLAGQRWQELSDPALRLKLAQAKLEDLAGKKINLSDLLALSLDGFSAEEKTAFYSLGAFAPKPASFSRTAAEAVTGAAPQLLHRLVNRNLLEIEGGALVLHQSLHELARQNMDAAAQDRHSAYYLALVNSDREDWRHIDTAYEQIRWAWGKIDNADCLDWVYALRNHQKMRGYWAESMIWLKRGLAQARKIDQMKDVDWMLYTLATTYYNLGLNDEALLLLEEELLMSRKFGDHASEIVTLNLMGLVYQATGRPQEALRLYEEALPVRRVAGDRAGVATTLNNMGGVYWGTGRPEEALRLYEEALVIRRAVGDRAGEATTLSNIGAVYYATGRSGEALRLYAQALPIMRAIGDRAGEAATLNNMASVYDTTGRPQEALRLYKQALLIWRATGARAGEAATLNNMGKVCFATGRPLEALRLFEEALPIMRAVGDRAGEAATLNNMGGVEDATGRPGEALRRYEQALPIMRAVGDRAGEAVTLNNMAGVHYATGRPQESLSIYVEALLIMREVGDRAGEAAALNNIGMVYRVTGRPQEALRIYEEALPITRAVGDRAMEATTLWNLAWLLRQLNLIGEGIEQIQAAIKLFEVGLSHSADGSTVEPYLKFLRQLLDEQGPPSAGK